MDPKLDELLSMAAFAHVVEARSFTAAAAKLGLSKSVVSTKLSQLEARLGVRLLQRTTRRLSMTTEGARLYERCARILRASEEAIEVVAQVGTLPHGLLRVTAPVGFGQLQLVHLLPAFAERYPRIRVDLALSDRMVNLAAEAFDVAIRFAPRVRELDLVARRIGTDGRVLCAAPSYLEHRAVPRVPEDLRGHNCLRLSARREREEWSFPSDDGPIVVPVSGNFIVDNVIALRSALLAGLGVAVMPQSIVSLDLKRGRLVPLLKAYPFEEIGVYALHAHGRHVPAKVRVFIDFLVEKLRPSAKTNRRRAEGGAE
jgi:DNA-binding transcriptional LysR family regulator